MATANIRTLKDNENNVFYPQTHIKAIVNDNGTAGIDTIPVSGSTNFVESGGVFDAINNCGVFDLSDYYSGATYASLSAALAAVPTEYQKGGMTLKYVQTSDNKYVSYFLTKNTWSTVEGDWEKVNIEEDVATSLQKLGLVVTKYAVQPYNNTAIWYGNEYTHVVIPVNGGEEVTYTALYDIYVAYLTDYITPVAGETPSFVPGYSGRQLITGGTFTIPSGTKYLIVNFPDLVGLTAMSIGGVNIFNGVYQSILGTIASLGALSQTVSQQGAAVGQSLKQSDLTTEIVSNNIANKNNIGAGLVDNHGTVLFAPISPSDTWRVLKVNLSASDEGKKITFGGFYLGRNGYAAFYNGDTLVGSVITFNDPDGSQTPTTVTVPSGCDRLYIDIMSGNSPYSLDANYTYLMVNFGDALLSYDQFKEEVSQIKGYDIMGSGDGESVVDIIADLPVSDGANIQSGYAYIDSTSRCVKVKA